MVHAARPAAHAGPWKPQNPAFAERVRASFARQGAMKTLGAELAAVGPGYCAITLVPRAEIAQQHGYVHAGVVAAIVDSAGGYAGFSLFPVTASVLTVEFKLNLLAPAEGERLVAEGYVVKPGRTLAVTRGEVHAEHGGRRTLVALMQQTLMLMHGKDE
ncbi:MAG TPA: PaaI family thioesterase [Casimicrobiaceae bacterium]|nr:PaaI family thioesterase [Casimicrobiaceae bacterium]